VRSFTEELVLVPKETKATYTPEDSSKVWLLGLVYDATKEVSSLEVVDGETMERQCRIWLKHASPHGLHGAWRGPPQS